MIFSSVQFSHSVVSNTLRLHELQHTRPPCPSPSPGVHSDSRPSSRWCHPATSSSVVPSPPAPNPSQHQSLFQESTLRMRWPKYWSFSFSIIPSKEHSGLISEYFKKKKSVLGKSCSLSQIWGFVEIKSHFCVFECFAHCILLIH